LISINLQHCQPFEISGQQWRRQDLVRGSQNYMKLFVACQWSAVNTQLSTDWRFFEHREVSEAMETLVWLPCVADADIIFLPWFLSIFFLA